VVWDAVRKPFGERTVAVGQVEVLLGFPGQYFDEESGNFYNYFRDYDPTTGRYLQSDPIGLDGGINTYGYVEGNPINYIDPHGLSKFDKTFGLPKKFWQWYHRNHKRPGDPDLDKDDAKDLFDEWNDMGKPGPDSKDNWKDLMDWLIPLPIQMACEADPCNPMCKDLGYYCPNDLICEL
jgi:RHS repeat-associated protein